MGCSVSLELAEKPSTRKSTKEAWEAVLARALAPQLHSSFKRMDPGYIAANFSANYASSLRRYPTSFKALHRDNLLICPHLPTSAEHNPQNSAVVDVPARKTQSPMPILQKVNEAFTGGKPIEGTKVKLETIDTWELMKDLNEQEDCAGVGPLHINDNHALMVNRCSSTTTLHDKPSHETVWAMASSNSAFVALIPRSESLTSFQFTEDINTCADASKDVLLVPERGSCVVSQGVDDISVNEVKELSRPTLGQLFDKVYHCDIASEGGRSPTCQFTCKTTSSTEIRHISSQDERPVSKCGNIRRALSMKYILNDSTSKNDRLHYSPVRNAKAACIDDVNSRESKEDDFTFHLASLSCESEPSSYLLSPEFSDTASLKDWLPSDSPSSTLADSIEDGFDAYIVEASQIVLAQQMAAYLLPNAQRVLSKYVGGGDIENASVNGLQYVAGTNMESCGAHTLDIKLMDSFITATHNEQYASPSLADSPDNMSK